MRASSDPELSVIVPVHTGERTLRGCLEALQASEGVRFEVIVVDDASTDASRDMASKSPVSLIQLPRRVGSAEARNIGAGRARAPILVFVDADVMVAPDTLKRIHEIFQERPGLSALFGSYACKCPHPGFFSQYKNLHHHYIHQTSRREASTFWTGCGAIRNEAFQGMGGFPPQEEKGPDLADIELGYRMRKAGYRIALVPEIQVVHDKPYTLISLLKSDLLLRAMPWTRMMWRNRVVRNDLNTRLSHMASVAILYLCLLSLSFPFPMAWKGLGLAMGWCAVACLNWRWIAFCHLHRGWGFALRAMGWEMLYFLYNGVGALAGSFLYVCEILWPQGANKPDGGDPAAHLCGEYYLPPPLAVHKGEVTARHLRAQWGERGPATRIFKTDLYEEAFGEDQILFRPMEPWFAELMVGIDLSLSVLQAARSRALSFGLKQLRVVRADVRAVPFKAATFGLILSTSTLDHFSGRQELVASLRELSRVSAPHGCLFITMDNPQNPWMLLRRIRPIFFLARRFGALSVPFGQTISCRGLSNSLKRHGWEVEPPGHFLHYPRAILILLVRLPLGRRWRLGLEKVMACLERLDKTTVGQFTGLYYALWAEKPQGPDQGVERH